MSPAPRKKKDEEAPTAAEVEAKASEEAGQSVPKADDDAAEKKPAKKAAAKKKTAAKKKPAAKKDEEPKEEAKDEPKEAAEEDKAEEPKAKQGKAKPPARKRDQPRAKREAGEAPVVVRAQARYVRTSARKARLVCDHIRGKDVEQARAILSFTPRGAAKPWLKLLESAIANAEHNHELVGDELKIHSIHADEGPTLKRYRPRAMGRATRIRKRTSHLTITLTPKE
jgi:large subunit ribosomal protein L22